jgi:hypothetical protein
MIVHEVKIGKQKSGPAAKGGHKRIYVGCAESDIRYRDMLVNFRQRWGFYTKQTIDFLTFDRNKSKTNQHNQLVEKIICKSDGVMTIVSSRTVMDPLSIWEIDCAVSNKVPIVGVDVGQNPGGNIPEKLVGKMTRYGWEWFATFINGL